MDCGCNKVSLDNRLGNIACSSTGRLDDNRIMDSCDCDLEQLVIKKGVCSEDKLINLLTTDEDTWTQLFIPEVLCIPSQKPDVEQLISITSRIEILSQKVIRTPAALDTTADPPTVLSISNEGIRSTGRKLVIEGILRQKIVYTAKVKEQSLHSAHFDVPFSAFIVLPPETPLATKYKLDVCIEDIFVSRITGRQIFKNVTIFIKATPLVCS